MNDASRSLKCEGALMLSSRSMRPIQSRHTERDRINRRDFLKAGALGVAGLGTAACRSTEDRAEVRRYGASTEYDRLRRVLVHAPSPAVGSLPTPEHLQKYNFDEELDHPSAVSEHARLVELLSDHGAEVIEVRDVLAGDSESLAIIDADPNFMFMRDVATMTPRGAVLMRMGLEARRPEVGVVAKALRRLGVPVVGQIESPGTLEGGSVMWLDPHTLVVGVCERVNLDGVAQLRRLSRRAGIDTIIAVDIPGHIHIDGILAVPGPGTVFTRVDRLTDARAVVHTGTTAREVRFLDELADRGYEISSYDRLCNTVYTSPFVGIAIRAWVDENIPDHLHGLGGRLDEFDGDELIKGYGGAHCLTCPIWRTSGA